jgi:manganese/zinc/iron transport system ATP- binding protein
MTAHAHGGSCHPRHPQFAYAARKHSEHRADMPAVEAKKLCLGYRGRSACVVCDADLLIEAGIFAALTGPNGSGKSTLLRAMAGLLRPMAGELSIFGVPQDACYHLVSYLPQRTEIDWDFPITLDRLVLTGSYAGLGWFRSPGTTHKMEARRLAALLGLETLAGRQIRELSGGQQQRALIARSLLQDADLLLLDEPMNGIDAASREIILRALSEEKARGKTILMATHDPHLIEKAFDRVISMEGLGHPAEVP